MGTYIKTNLYVNKLSDDSLKKLSRKEISEKL